MMTENNKGLMLCEIESVDSVCPYYMSENAFKAIEWFINQYELGNDYRIGPFNASYIEHLDF